MEQILNLQHISYTYHTLEGETPALSDISFSLNKGEFAAIVGPSGCGKSTLLSLICGLLPCSDGQITINGRHLKESTTNVGYMLQHDELFEWRTIYNNVILGLEIVLSRRPAAIIQTIPLIFHLEEDTPMNRRNAPEFKSYFNLIWKELNQDEKSS